MNNANRKESNITEMIHMRLFFMKCQIQLSSLGLCWALHQG